MRNEESPSSSVQPPSEQPDTFSRLPFSPEACLRLQRPFSSNNMPQALLARDETPPFHPQRPNYHAPTKYSTQVPLMVQISPGIWSDGKHNVMAANHPDVKAFIAEARRTLKLPLPPSEVVFVLAALEVFYRPGDPVHWLFWSDEKKYVTADVVTRISLHQPALIRSKVAWNGTPEYLSILANHHGSTWRQFFEDKDWYLVLVPPKSGMTKLPNLRKRKVAPGAMREQSRSPSLEGEQEPEEPIPKKSRNAPPKCTEMLSACNSNSGQVDIPLPTAVSPAVSDNSMQLDELTPMDTPHITQKLLHQENAEKKVSTLQTRPNGHHQRRRKRLAAAETTEQPNGANISSRASSNDPADTTIPASSIPLSTVEPSSSSSSSTASSSNAHLRNRSTSYASAETLVGSSQGRRSSSVLSTSTAVDGKNAKHKDADSAQGKLCELDSKTEDPDATTNEVDDDDSVGVVTRGRARGKAVEKAPDAVAVSRLKTFTSSANPRRRSKKSKS